MFPSELTYGPGADYGHSSLSCDVEDDLGNDCLAWSSGHVIQRQRLQALSHEPGAGQIMFS